MGVNILLKEYDWYANETFAEVHTGSDGYFSFTYNEDQSFAEGKTITLFLKYKSRNTTYDIKVKEHSVFGGSYEETTWLSDQGQNVSLNLGEVYLDNDAYKPLHYAVRAWQFSNNNGIYLRPDLTILAYQAESYFLPDGAGGISSPITRPTIRLGDGDENDENTIYHEFGHFFQWNVQDKNYATPIFKDKSGDHVWYETNTSRAAWTEGWADAFQMILDAAYWYEDMEYGYDNDDVRPTYEVRDIWNFSNGMESEYYIACAIYDLWDGKNKGLPNRMPRRPGTPNIHGYNDEENGTWETTDNVQLSFNQIVRPMRINSSSSSVIGNIYTYYSLLVNNVLKDECNLVSDVARCFNENRVVEDVFHVGFNTGMSSDGIGRETTKTFHGELLFLGTDMTYTDTYKLNNFSGVLNNHTGAGEPYYITDPIILGMGRISRMELNINAGAYYTCWGTDITVKNGKLVLGGNGTTAEIQINQSSILKAENLSELEVKTNGKFIVNNLGLIDLQSGSTTTVNSGDIIVKSGGTLYIREFATLNLLGTSKIIIEPGGFVCMHIAANVNVSGLGKFELKDGANIGTNPLVINSSDCRTDFCFSNSITFNTDALDFDGIDDYVEVSETNGSLNLGVNDFTFEAIFKSDPIGVASGIQILASKRNDFNVPPQQTDGFMWGLWPDGHIYAQLGGTPNIGYDQGPNFLDGSCHHVALTRQGSLITFYNDGVAYYSYTLGARDISSTGSLRIGRNHFSNVPFDGLIGEVRIWNVARTGLDLQNNIGVNLTPQDGLVGYWDMTGQSSQFLADLSGNNNIGVLGNSISCSGDNSDPIWVEASMLSCNVQSNFRKGEYTTHDLGSNSNSSINIYPNPFINEVTINLTILKTATNAKIVIVNSSGVEVFNEDVIKLENEFQYGSELTKGVYFVKLTSDGYNKVFKLVKS